MTIDVSVILVSYNTRDMTIACLTALARGLGGITSEILLVDNASNDGSATAIRNHFPDVRILENSANRGFGAANNQGMKQALGRYFVLLNTDAFVQPEVIRGLVQYMDQYGNVAAAGPRLLNADGTHQDSIHRFDSPWRALQQYVGLERLTRRRRAEPELISSASPPRSIDNGYLKGACLIVRREVYERIGGFDERFFFYGDEADWEKRMVAAGWELHYLPQPTVTHLVGKSGSTKRLTYTLHYYAARDQYMGKHFGARGLLVYRLGVTAWCIRKLLQQLVWVVHPRRQVNPFAVQVHLFLICTILSASRDLGRLAEAWAAEDSVLRQDEHASESRARSTQAITRHG